VRKLLIYAFRSWDWESSLRTSECILKYFIAHNLLKCARLLPRRWTHSSVRGFCCREVKDPIHEVVHRSDARAGEKSIEAPRRYGGVNSRRSRPRPPSHHVTASHPYGKEVKVFLKYSRLLSRISALLGCCCKNAKKHYESLPVERAALRKHTHLQSSLPWEVWCR